MMENEALQVIQKMNVKINGTEDEVKKVYGALEVAKRALKKGIEAHPLGALHDVKKRYAVYMFQLWYPFGMGTKCSETGELLSWMRSKNRLEGHT